MRANKMHFIKKYVLLGIIGLSALAGCKKNSTHTYYDQLTGNWYVKNQTISGTTTSGSISPITSSNYTNQDYYKFGTDKTVIISQSTPPSIVSSTYTFDSGTSATGLIVTIADADKGGKFTVDKLSADSLVMSQVFTIPNVSTTTLKLRLARQ